MRRERGRRATRARACSRRGTPRGSPAAPCSDRRSSPSPQNDLRHGVGEVRRARACRRSVSTMRHWLRVAGHDQRAGASTSTETCRGGGRHEEQVDAAPSMHRAVGDVDERAVRGERRVERGERPRAELRQLPEVALDDRRPARSPPSPASRRGRRPAARRQRDSSGENRPFTIDEPVLHVAVDGARASRVGGTSRRAGSNSADAIGATFVNRHSSSRVVGNPSAANRAAARSCRSCSHRGPLRAGAGRARRATAGAFPATCVIALTLRPAPRRSRASRSPSPRARAPAPCRRTSRCARRSARARSPARCSRAAAGSA